MKNKYFLKLFIVLVFCFVSGGSKLKAQVSQQWDNYYNSPTNGSDIPVAMVTDNTGNTYITGVSFASTTGDDFATVKFNSAGVQQWAARYHNPDGQDDVVRGIAVDALGNVYVTGSISMGGSNGVLMTVKYNSEGEQQWAKQLGLPTASPAGAGRGKSPIALDASGNIYVGGSRRFGSGQNSSYVLIKYNAGGDSLWSRTYKGSHFLAGLGNGIVCIKVDGNYIYVTGKSFDQNPDLSTSCFATTIKYDLSGNPQWIRKDTLINGSDEVIGMEIDPSENIIVFCDHGLNILTLKYNPSGALLWKRSYTGIAGNYYDRVSGIDFDLSGNIYLTGSSVRTTASGGDDFLTLKYDASGNQLWERYHNGTGNNSDYSKGITVDSEGNSYISGSTYRTGFHTDFMTIKYDTDGNQIWSINYYGMNINRNDQPVAIELDHEDNLIVSGVSERTGSNDDFALVKYSQTTGINQISQHIPEKFSLSQNYPNPFNPDTNLEFGISELGFVSLKVYDMLGKEIATLVNENLNPGIYKYNFDASGFASGIYFYKLVTVNFSATKKMILTK